jgi:hypothetical protein
MTEADHIARDSANRAISLIEAHERICSERQGHILENLSELKRGVEGLYRRFWTVAVGVIALLISACGGLIYLILAKVS